MKENKTDVTRVILFCCDVERPMSNRLMRWMNRSLGRRVARATTENVPGEPAGALNKVFGDVYLLRVGALHIKRWNRTVYYVLIWLLLGGLVYLVVR
jgi:beta-hydroxylase